MRSCATRPAAVDEPSERRAGNSNETTAGPWTYGFNLADQLISATSGAISASYSYDGDGNRLSMTTAGATTNYSWDPNFAVPQLSLERDSTGNLIRRYLYGEGRISVTTPQTTAYFSVDDVGSPTALSDSNGASLGSYDRNPFGDGATSSGVDPSVADVPIGFTGELQDPVTGLVDLRARNYDPGTGRFVSIDPLGQYATPSAERRIGASGGYSYTAANPVTRVDPTGLKYGGGCASVTCALGVPPCPAEPSDDTRLSPAAPFVHAAISTDRLILGCANLPDAKDIYDTASSCAAGGGAGATIGLFAGATTTLIGAGPGAVIGGIGGCLGYVWATYNGVPDDAIDPGSDPPASPRR